MFWRNPGTSLLEKHSNDDCSAVKKKLEENFGSEETKEAKKRPGAIFDHREPSRNEESGIRDKNRRRTPNIRTIQDTVAGPSFSSVLV